MGASVINAYIGVLMSANAGGRSKCNRPFQHLKTRVVTREKNCKQIQKVPTSLSIVRTAAYIEYHGCY